MKRLCYVGFLATVLLGTGLHFSMPGGPFPCLVYLRRSTQYLGAPKAALLAVSGSLRVLSHWARSPVSFWGRPGVCWLCRRFCWEAGTRPGMAFGVESTAFDIGLYGLVVALGFLLLCRLQKRPWTERQVGICIMLAGLWGGALLIGSVAPLELPLFEP